MLDLGYLGGTSAAQVLAQNAWQARDVWALVGVAGLIRSVSGFFTATSGTGEKLIKIANMQWYHSTKPLHTILGVQFWVQSSAVSSTRSPHQLFLNDFFDRLLQIHSISLPSLEDMIHSISAPQICTSKHLNSGQFHYRLIPDYQNLDTKISFQSLSIQLRYWCQIWLRIFQGWISRAFQSNQ